MKTRKKILKIRDRRARRTRSKIFGTAEKPRLSVFRSNRFIYAQLIDDSRGVTLLSASSREFRKDGGRKKKTEEAAILGKLIAEKAAALGIKKAVFDRGFYKYHGRVAALAEAVRAGGLKI